MLLTPQVQAQVQTGTTAAMFADAHIDPTVALVPLFGTPPAELADVYALYATQMATKIARDVQGDAGGGPAVLKPVVVGLAFRREGSTADLETERGRMDRVMRLPKRKAKAQRTPTPQAHSHREAKAESTPTAATPKKQKRGNAPAAATRTVFSADGDAQSSTAVAGPEDATPSPAAGSGKYIVFIGNMPFDVTSDMLAKHLASTCGETPSVRLLTRRADPSALDKLSASKKKSIAKGKAHDPSAPKSKGCAFAEFSTPVALQKALRFHHTAFHGRQINVELTAGGGGKGEQRKEKIKQKNTELEKERRKLHEKYVKPEAEAQKRKRGEARENGGVDAQGDGDATPAKPAALSGYAGTRPAKRAKFASGANAVRLA
ncbi:hypothetical protein MSPP1_003456 [Malassezia sp. CBS 17886]|nr:hypothetical protein MSPP1_003456 [Malassezia sp. CBS 17886]